MSSHHVQALRPVAVAASPPVALALLAAVASVLVWLLVAQGAPSSRVHARRGLDAVPPAAHGAVSRALGSHDERLFARPVGGGFAVTNRVAGVHASFSRAGAAVRVGGLSWSLGLRAYGRGGRLAAVDARAPAASRNRVAYRRPGVREWYANGPLGLEQGFTLAQPPSTGGRGPLTLALGRLPNGAHARVTAGGRDVTVARDGRDVLRYEGLFASDARGRRLPARVEVSGGRLVLRVDDRGARYPVLVDPFVQAARLTASDGAAGDTMGFFVGVSGHGGTVAVGAPGARIRGSAEQGAVYVFVKPRGGWANATETAKLTASDGGAGDSLGFGVSISGDGATVAGGAPGAKGDPTRGATYVFVRPRGGWRTATETAKLTASDGKAGDGVGFGVAIAGDGATVVAGAPGRRNLGAGATYVFVKPRRGWRSATETAKLTASDGVARDFLGTGVAVSRHGRTIISGAPGASHGAGATYVFVKRHRGWAERAKLTASDAAGGDLLGTGVGVSADGATVAAGAMGDDGVRGSAYAYVRPRRGWRSAAETAKLTASDGLAGDFMGISVAVSGDGRTIASGAPAHDGVRGAVYTYVKPRGGWRTTAHETAELTANAAAGDSVGAVVAFSRDGRTIGTGAVFGRTGVQATRGAAYVFSKPKKPRDPNKDGDD